MEQVDVLRTWKTETNPSLASEKDDTPPGSQATACCSKEYTGTWKNLSLPSSIGSKLHKDCGFTGTRRPKPNLVAYGAVRVTGQRRNRFLCNNKIVQKAVAKILSAIYEQDFQESSYGFRNKRSAHDALRVLELMIIRKNVNYILDVDIKGYFDNIDQHWLMEKLRQRIVDRTILRLIGKWLKAGVLDEGKRISSDTGVPQGSVISPLLANIYLHYVLDLWTRKISRRLIGRIYLVRYCDDFVIGSTNRKDAETVWKMLQDRVQKFGPEISQEKSRGIEFVRRHT